MSKSKYGIPYMGSKSGIAPSIFLNLPKAEHFYDLFGGGFSMTHYAIKNQSHKYKHFHYNEINSCIVDLVKRAIAGDFDYGRFKPEWVSREKFFKEKDSNAYIRVCWSFGNDQRQYLFSKEIEPYKKSMHQAVVFDEFNEISTELIGKSWPKDVNTIYLKRIYLRQKIEYFRKTKIPDILKPFLNSKQLQQLERLQRLGQLEPLKQMQQLAQLERLQQLQQLERLQHLEHLEHFHFYSGSYEDIPIKKNSVVYCDIPYKGTASYLNEFDHQSFYEWAATRSFPVFVSEYNIDDPRFEQVYCIKKVSRFNNSGDNTVAKDEKLYWNGVS